jgi:hypothetical protein
MDHNSNPDKAALVSPDIQSSEIDSYDWQVHVALGLRRFFVGAGYSPVIGVGPEDMMQGDRIALLNGGRVPYILRWSEEQNGCWIFVGDAYVHAVMDGEGVKLAELQEITLV